jgi:hypothetical protein
MIAYINLVFVFLFLGGAAYFWQQGSRVKKNIVLPEQETTPDKTLVSISVPKNNERTPQAAEQIFAALHGMFRPGLPTQPQISCELVSKGHNITFYMYMPTDMRDFVLSQIYAQYPHIEIKEVEPEDDYTRKLKPEQVFAATELALKKDSVYPIKTFDNFEVDPLSPITGVLSAIGENEEMWIQMVIRPVDDDWQEKASGVIKDIKEPPSKPKGVFEMVAGEARNFAIDFARNAVNPSATTAEKKEDKKDDKKELAGPVQQAIKGIEEKTTKLGYEANIRLLAAAADEYVAKAKLEQLIGAYKQFNSINQNGFIAREVVTNRDILHEFQARSIDDAALLFNTLELASLYHLPSQTVTTPTISWAGSKKGEPPNNLPIIGSVPADELTVFAQTNFRNEIRKFGLKKKDRRLHTYIIGKTGTGKSTLMENMIYDDIREGRGVAVVDPHGELIDHILNYIPPERVQDVIYFNPADSDFPVGFNLLENVNPEMKNVVASGVVGIFKKIFGESWGPRLEYILRNAVLALLDYPNSTLVGVMRVLTDNAFRRLVVSTIKDPVIKDFFINEYEKYEPKFRQEAIAPIQNKVGQFLSSSTIRNIIGQPKSTINVGDIMNQGKILLADLSTGKIGEDNSALLGSMLITKIQLSAMDRTNIPEDERRDFYLYVDEFQNFATDSFATILSEARKYRLDLVMTNQYISQMPETVANAVFGNVGTMVAFRVGASDAQVLQKEFEPVFDVNDLVNQPNRQIYLKMAIDGVTMPAFSAGTLPPPEEKANLKTEVVAASREQFSRARGDVEEYIAEWSAPIDLSQMGIEQGSPPKDRGRTFAEAPKPDAPIVPKPMPATPAVSERTEEVRSEAVAGESASIIPEAAPAAPEEPKVLQLPEGKKIEMLKDRFDRKWYAMSDQSASGSNAPLPMTADKPTEEGSSILASTAAGEPLPIHRLGEPEAAIPVMDNEAAPTPEQGSEALISWEKADELGLNLTDTAPVVRRNEPDDLLPIDEL